jgi:hypothetical protein
MRRLARDRGIWTTALMCLPPLAICGASVLQTYPMAARLSLFALPLGIVLIAAGLKELTGRLTEPHSRAALVAGALVFPVLGLPGNGHWVMREEQWNDAKELIERLSSAPRPDEPVYIGARGVPVWLFYTTDWRDPDRERVTTLTTWSERGGLAFENAPSRGRPVGACEGENLILHRRGTELIGLPTGMQLRSNSTPAPWTPDTGWAEREVARLAALRQSRVWLVFLRPSIDQGQLLLLGELERAGGRPLDHIAYREALAWKYDLGRVKPRQSC